MKPFLEVKNLSVSFPTQDGLVKASNDISFTVARGETLAIVGESGSGKSVTSLAVMGLHNRNAADISGEAILNLETGPIDTISASPEVVRKLRGKSMAMIFQDPMSALHPYYSIGDQIAEAWGLYNKGSKSDGIKRAVEMLDLVGIPEAAKRVKEFPHQFSGGMRQRVMIAMALVNNPSLLIADEPTTALDVTVQSQILKLLKDMQQEFNMAVILITHDLGVVAEVADRACVMYAGKIVEQSAIDDIYYTPDHPYTIGLLNSIPRVDQLEGKRLLAIPGQPPSLISLPRGCAFRGRCTFSRLVPNNRCATEVPNLDEKIKGHFSRCHLTEAQLTVARTSVGSRV
ncbi:MAG: ABC transporter ATP-binding protein [Actinobacteria bacterium]|nr:ABC transporter ATP-binding protein [Actinomycetota bacterium]